MIKSSTSIGSWNEETKEFFANSSDDQLKVLGDRHVVVRNEQDAIAAVVNGSLCYYENVHVLLRERVKRQILEDEMLKNASYLERRKAAEHNLHIMEDCIINMPVSLGMDKNSPLKYRVDEIVCIIIKR